MKGSISSKSIPTNKQEISPRILPSVTTNEPEDLRAGREQLPVAAARDMMCPLRKEHRSPLISPKGSNRSLRPLDPAADFQEIHSTEGHTQLYHECEISKT